MKAPGRSTATSGCPGWKSSTLKVTSDSQPVEQLLGGEPGLQTEAFDLLRQLGHEAHHRGKDKYPVQINQTEGIAFLDVVFLSQLGRQRDHASLAYLNGRQRPLGFGAAHYGREMRAGGTG